MTKIKTIIIDDEPKIQKVMEMKLQRYCPAIDIVGIASNIIDGYDLIQKYQVDLIFLDIAMPEGSGFDLLDRFDHINFEIIFATGFNDYALEALKVSAVDYLLKPINTEELIAAVAKVTAKIEARENIKMYHVLKHNLNHVGRQESKVAIPGTVAYDFVKISDIIRCEGWQKYTKIYLLNGSCIVSSYNIGVFKDMLRNYDFYTTHKSHLINTKLIARYLKEGIVVMQDKSEVPVSRRKRDDFVLQVVESKVTR